jgi:hypothetical protein
MLSPHSNEKVDLLNIVEALYGRELDQNELLAKFLRKFLAAELMPFNDKEIEDQVKNYAPFSPDTEHSNTHMQEFLR